MMFSKQFKLAGILLCVGLASFFQASAAWGFSTFTSDNTLPGDSSGFSDLIANPSDYWSWDDTSSGVIALTYKFDSSFTTDNRIRNQVRLAFNQWDTASSMADGTTYSYQRANGVQDFGDLRSIAVHEIGHVLGYHHPDLATGFGRNYVPDSPLVAQADQNNEVMRSWIPRGSYNQILSHDELDGFDYVYGTRNFNFTETTGSADILVKASSLSSGNIWAQAGPSGFYRNGGDHHQGVRSTSGEVTFNSTSTYGMGYRTLGVNWDFQNTGGDTRAFELVTRGTINTVPIFHYDGSAGQKFDTLTTVSTGDDNNKDNLKHTWSNPRVGGVPDDFPAGNVVHVGLELDVWDWSVVSAEVVHPVGPNSPAPILGMHDWNQAVTGVALSAGEGSGESGIHMGPPLRIVAEGMRLVNSETVATEIVSMGLAMVDKMGLQLQDLNRDQLERLIVAQRVEWLDDGIAGRTLDNSEELFLIFDGQPTGIGDPIFLDPKWAGHELFVFVETKAGEVTVGNYALLGTPAIVGVPEPGTVAMLVGAGLMGLLALRRRRRSR